MEKILNLGVSKLAMLGGFLLAAFGVLTYQMFMIQRMMTGGLAGAVIFLFVMMIGELAAAAGFGLKYFENYDRMDLICAVLIGVHFLFCDLIPEMFSSIYLHGVVGFVLFAGSSAYLLIMAYQAYAADENRLAILEASAFLVIVLDWFLPGRIFWYRGNYQAYYIVNGLALCYSYLMGAYYAYAREE